MFGEEKNNFSKNFLLEKGTSMSNFLYSIIEKSKGDCKK